MVTRQEHEDVESRIQAELQVEAFIQLLATRYNLRLLLYLPGLITL